MQKPDLIMGLILWMEPNFLEPFFKTLGKTGYSGKVVMFCSEIPTETIQYLENKNVEIQFFNCSEAKNLVPLLAFRHFLYKRYLDENVNNFNRVFLADIRDLSFQRDPFDFKMDYELNLFYEDYHHNIGDCFHNRLFILGKFGIEELDKIKDKRISCAGTVIGTAKAIHHYLTLTTQILLPPPTEELGKIEGYDQGVHNWLLHNGYFSRVASIFVYENNDGPVCTLPGMDRNDIVFDSENRILNKNGSVVNIIHGLDKTHRDVAEKLATQWM